MARISLSPLIVDIRNKIGDTVFSKWKGVNYARSRVDPSNPNTVNQQEVRDALRQLVTLWQALAGIVRTSWADFASGRNLSGFNAFVGVNAVDQRAATPIELTKDLGETSLATFGAATGSGAAEIDITYTISPVAAGKRLHVIAREVSGGVETGAPELFSFAAGVASPQTLTMAKAATDYVLYAFQADSTLALATICSPSLNDSATSHA